MIKAILFDMDGVLIDAKIWHYDALNRALRHFGYTISPESHLTTFDGLPTHNKLTILSQSKHLPSGLHELINQLKQIYTLEITHQRCKPVFNHQQALRSLKNEGYKIAVCSNSIRATIKTMMKLSSLNSYLDLILSNQDVIDGKPNPEIYIKAMQHLEVSPNECLILEDNDNGIKAALASGGHLLKVGTPSDVKYETIKRRIQEIEGA